MPRPGVDDVAGRTQIAPPVPGPNTFSTHQTLRSSSRRLFLFCFSFYAFYGQCLDPGLSGLRRTRGLTQFTRYNETARLFFLNNRKGDFPLRRARTLSTSDISLSYQ